MGKFLNHTGIYWYLFTTSKTNNAVKQVNLVSTSRILQPLSTEYVHAFQVCVRPFNRTYYMLIMNYIKYLVSTSGSLFFEHMEILQKQKFMRVYEEIKKKIGNVRNKNEVNVVFRGKFITLNTYLYKKETLKVSNVCFQG